VQHAHTPSLRPQRVGQATVPLPYPPDRGLPAPPPRRQGRLRCPVRGTRPAVPRCSSANELGWWMTECTRRTPRPSWTAAAACQTKLQNSFSFEKNDARGKLRLAPFFPTVLQGHVQDRVRAHLAPPRTSGPRTRGQYVSMPRAMPGEQYSCEGVGGGGSG
jgi:hypothetical protein